MNKIKQILIGASVLALSGNAAAIITNDDGPKIMEFSDYEPAFIQNVIAGDYDVAQWVRNKVDRKYRKHGEKAEKLATAQLSKQRAKHLRNKITRKETKIAKFLSRVGLETVALNISDEPGGPGSEGNGNHNGEGNGHGNGNGNGNGQSVPEPSTIALLGLGLVGIGAARRLRKRAH